MGTFTKVDKPAEHSDEVIYQGSNSTTTINTLEFQPDWFHFKNRNENADGFHTIINTVDGTDKQIYFNDTDGLDSTDSIASVTSNGCTLTGNRTFTNISGDGFVTHFLKLASSTTNNSYASSGVGSNDSSYRANTTSGISVVKYTGNGSNSTIAHGLGKKPNCIIIKDTEQDGHHWQAYFHSGNEGGNENGEINETDVFQLFNNDGNQSDDNTAFNDTEPTTEVFSLGTKNDVNENGIDFTALVIANTNGMVRAGTYQGNGNAHGPFIFTGFLPQIIWTFQLAHTEDPHKKTITTRFTDKTGAAATGGGSNHGNPIELNLKMGDASTKQEQVQCKIDFFSNGFAPRSTDGKHNGDGFYYAYIAFAKNPMIGTNNILGTAFG